jgi:hypothetical protein
MLASTSWKLAATCLTFRFECDTDKPRTLRTLRSGWNAASIHLASDDVEPMPVTATLHADMLMEPRPPGVDITVQIVQAT